MSTRVEERLRRALAQQAETTTTSPDGWRRIQDAVGAGARRRRFAPWNVLAPAAAVAVVLVVLALMAGGQGGRPLRVAGEPDALHLMPTGVEPRFRLVNVATAKTGGPSGPTTYRAFGRRGPDGVGLEASVVITIPGDLARNGAEPDPAPLRVLGQDVIVGTNPFGQRALRWYQADGREVGLLTYGLSPAEVVTVVESLLRGDASTDAPTLPAGLRPIDVGSLPSGASPVSILDWESDDGARFTMSVVEGAGATLDGVAVSMPGGRARKLRATTAIYLPAADGYLAWLERPQTVVSLHGAGLSEQDLVSIAQGLRPVADEQWRAIETRFAAKPPDTIGPLPDIGPPPGVVPSPTAWLGFLPVRERAAPPCRPIQELWLAEVRAGQEVACYKVGGPGLNAGDIASATARQDRPSGTWTVELILTEPGTARLAALFRDVGAGGQYAIVVDGKLVSVVRFDGAPSPKALITGLDEKMATMIVDRLPR
jgi:hypothetical protein